MAYWATPLAHLKANDYPHMRHIRINLPKVQPVRATPKPEQS